MIASTQTKVAAEPKSGLGRSHVIASTQSICQMTYREHMWTQVHVMYRQPPRLQPMPRALHLRMWQTCYSSCQPTR